MRNRRWFRGRRRVEVNCREVGRNLQNYLDRGVGPELSELITVHLEKCRECGLEHETYLQIRESLSANPPPIDESIIARLQEFGRKLTSE